MAHLFLNLIIFEQYLTGLDYVTLWLQFVFVYHYCKIFIFLCSLQLDKANIFAHLHGKRNSGCTSNMNPLPFWLVFAKGNSCNQLNKNNLVHVCAGDINLNTGMWLNCLNCVTFVLERSRLFVKFLGEGSLWHILFLTLVFVWHADSWIFLIDFMFL